MAEQVAEATKKKDIPLWLGIALVLIGLAGAAWFIWSQTGGFWTGSSGVFTIEGVTPGAPTARTGQRQRMVRPPQQDAIRQLNDNNWRVRSNFTSLSVRKNPNGEYGITMAVFSMRILPPDAQWVLVTRGRLDDAAAANIGLTPQQAKQFKGLPTSPSFPVTPSPEQVKQIQEAFKKYVAATGADKANADREIAALTDQVGTQLLPTVQQKAQADYDAVKKSVGQDKWDKLKAIASAAPPAAAPAAPATRPAP